MTRIFVVFSFLILLLFSSYPAHAQKSPTTRKIGFLTVTAAPIGALEVFRRSLAEMGYVEGQNIVIDVKGADERPKLLELAHEFIRDKVDVIVANSGTAARAAKEATKTVPIVFTSSGEPVEGGLAASLARPGGNMTGMSWLAFELVGKRLELLKEAVPKVSRVAILSNPQHAGEQRELKETQNAGRTLGISLDYHQTRTHHDFETAFKAIANEKVNGLLVFPESLTLANRLRIIEFANRNRLPSMFGWKEFVEAGALMAYGPNRDETYKRIAVQVDKILKGAKPGDLPVELPHRFELVISLTTAKQLGLTIPPTALARADQVIK